MAVPVAKNRDSEKYRVQADDVADYGHRALIGADD